MPAGFANPDVGFVDEQLVQSVTGERAQAAVGSEVHESGLHGILNRKGHVCEPRA